MVSFVMKGSDIVDTGKKHLIPQLVHSSKSAVFDIQLANT